VARIKWTLEKALPYILLIGGAIGVLLSVILTVEKITLLSNPTTVLNCDINPIISCGSTINKPQASVLGIPNTLIGIVGFSAVATIGAALLAGAQFKRWFWRGLQGGMTFGIIAVGWLQYQALYEIGALCPFCLVTWTIMIPMFLYTTLYNLRHGTFTLTKRLDKVLAYIQRNHLGILIVWYLVIIGLILQRFWDYWSSLL
jgi:uncharacterized membrane protein